MDNVNTWNTISNELRNVLKLNLLSFEMDPLNNDSPKSVNVYRNNNNNSNMYIIYSNAFPSTFNRKFMNYNDLISFDILSTLNALNMRTDLSTVNDDLPESTKNIS